MHRRLTPDHIVQPASEGKQLALSRGFGLGEDSEFRGDTGEAVFDAAGPHGRRG